jgi:hypothetical protein
MTRCKLLAMLALASCSVRSPQLSEPDPDAVPAGATDAPALDSAPDATPDAGPVPTGLIVEAPNQLRTGELPVALGAATGRFCFLQSVAGMFKAPSHDVAVAVIGATWELHSAAFDATVIARCVTFAATSGITMTEQFDWTQGQPAVDMGPFGDRICALTRMAGTFNGGGELVHAAGENNRWLLRGTSGVGGGGVSVSARCLVFPPETAVTFSGETNWAQGDAPATLAPLAQHACVMRLIVGSFLGGGERVSVDASATSWVLSGSSGQQGVAVRSSCMSWP